MAAMTLLPRSRPLTRADLDAIPDDGHRYELIDGTLIVTPAPSPRHQLVLSGLYRALYAGCPPGLHVLFAPLDVAIAEDTVLQPDLLVAPASAFTARDLPIAPLLAVEVLSPSTRRFDLSLKRDRYADAGCPSYWVVDPDEPGITAWELGDEGYVRVGHAIAQDELRLSRPYDVTIVPARLLE